MATATDSTVGGLWQNFHVVAGDRTATRAHLLHRSIVHRTTKLAASGGIYAGCSMSAEFQDFQTFAGWCNSQAGYHLTDESGRAWVIDKDLICKGNRVYGPDRCTFVPNSINALIQRGKPKRSCLPVGVVKSGGKYVAQCAVASKATNYIGHFTDKYLAFAAYKQCKEAEIKRVAMEFKGRIDERLFESLMAWSIEWGD